jgi:ABC-type bacteriocin/lantibiotic exporter with double-glycine peptidase domain
MLMNNEIPANCTLWFPHHFFGDTRSLGRQGVFFQQSHGDCGGASLKMIFERFDVAIDYGLLWRRLQNGSTGTTMLDIKQLAESTGLVCDGWRISTSDLFRIPLPAILLVHRKHFVVLAGIDAARGALILDPVRGRLRVSMRRLMSVWHGETLIFHKPVTGSPQNSRKQPRARCHRAR